MINLRFSKRKAGIIDLEKTLPVIPGNIGIGHTRWATHGKPNKINAHPILQGI